MPDGWIHSQITKSWPNWTATWLWKIWRHSQAVNPKIWLWKLKFGRIQKRKEKKWVEQGKRPEKCIFLGVNSKNFRAEGLPTPLPYLQSGRISSPLPWFLNTPLLSSLICALMSEKINLNSLNPCFRSKKCRFLYKSARKKEKNSCICLFF